MIRMTSNDYYDFLEKVLERYETGELSEEEARQMVNDAVIDEWKSDPYNANSTINDYKDGVLSYAKDRKSVV